MDRIGQLIENVASKRDDHYLLEFIKIEDTNFNDL